MNRLDCVLRFLWTLVIAGLCCVQSIAENQLVPASSHLSQTPSSEFSAQGRGSSRSLFIEDTLFVGKVGDDLSERIFGELHQGLTRLEIRVLFDDTKLGFLTRVVDPGKWPQSRVTIKETPGFDTAVFELSNADGAPAFLGTEVARLKFELLCGLANDQTTLFIVDDSCLVNSCDSASGAGLADSAVVSLIESASLTAKAVPGFDGPVGKNNSGSMLSWNIMLKNTFVAGQTGSFLGEEGIVIGVGYGTSNLQSIAVSNHDGFTFGATEISKASEGYIWQTDGDSTDYVGPQTSPKQLVQLSLEWNSSGFSVPTWANRYIKPRFQHQVAHSSSNPKTTITDTLSCLAADSATGDLTFGSFDSVLVKLAELQQVNHFSQTPCSYADLSVRSTFDIGKVRFKVTAGNALTCVTGISSLAPGISVTFNSTDRSYLIQTSPEFNAIPQDTSFTRICRVNVGISGSSEPGRYSPMAIAIDGAQVFSASDTLREEFLTQSTAGALFRAKSPPSGAGCPGCEHAIGPSIRVVSDPSTLPREFVLQQNYPNPFNPETKIQLDIPKASEWEITIYNISGQVVERFSGYSEPGVVAVTWNASQYASGIYLYKGTAGSFTATRKMALIK